MNEIKMCPLCGSTASVRISEELQDVSDVANLVVACDNPKCQIYQKELHETFEEAIAAWNARAPVDEWISTEWETPCDIGCRVLIFPIDGEIECAEYLGEGLYRFHDYTIDGTDFTHWQPLPAPPHETTENEKEV